MKKVSKQLTLTGVCLLGLVGCSTPLSLEESEGISISMDEEGTLQHSENDWGAEMSFGITVNQLFEEMNRLNDQLNLDERQLIADKSDGEEYAKIGLLNGNVFIHLGGVEAADTSNPMEIGKFAGLSLVYDRTNPEAIAYAQAFIDTFHQISIQNLLASEDDQVKGSFETWTTDFKLVNHDTFESFDDQTVTLLTKAGITETNATFISFSRQ